MASKSATVAQWEDTIEPENLNGVLLHPLLFMRPVLISTGYFFSLTQSRVFTPCPLGQALANSDEEVHYFFALLQGWHSKLMLHEYLASTPPLSYTPTS